VRDELPEPAGRSECREAPKEIAVRLEMERAVLRGPGLDAPGSAGAEPRAESDGAAVPRESRAMRPQAGLYAPARLAA
jgi:hypothetical protein